MGSRRNRTRSAIKDAFNSVNGEVKNVGDHIFRVCGVLEPRLEPWNAWHRL